MWIILFPFLPAAAALYIYVYICLPFFFPLSLSVSFLSFFYFFLCICSRRLYPTTLDYARKIGNPGPHYSTVFNFFFFLFVAVFSRSSGFRTFLLRPFVPVYLVLVQPLVCYTNEMTKSFLFAKCLSADRLRNGTLSENCDEIS